MFLKNKSCGIAVVINGNKKSAILILRSLGIYKFIDLLISNEDVTNPKPHSEPYIKAISHFGGDLKKFIIFEDSEIGLTAAYGTGCKVYKVENINDINVSLIINLNNLNRNILIPAAGLGSRFQKRGFKLQKPLIFSGIINSNSFIISESHSISKYFSNIFFKSSIRILFKLD